MVGADVELALRDVSCVLSSLSIPVEVRADKMNTLCGDRGRDSWLGGGDSGLGSW